MKRIGIDARLFSQTGVGVYLRNFLHYLQEEDTIGFEFFIYVMKDDSSKIIFTKHNFKKIEVEYKWHSLGEQTGFKKTLEKDKLDLMHFTYFSYPILYRRKFIATIHDTILLKHKTGQASTRSPLMYELKYKAAKLTFAHQVHNAELIITPSNTVKNELLTIFGQKYDEKILPIFEGVNYELFNTKEDLSLKGQFKKDDFFMYVGNFYPHKNIERLIEAFSQVNTEKKLLLLGGEDFFTLRLKELITSLGLDARILFFSKPTNSQLVYFYKNAHALIHPSIAEGFCLPLVEAAYFKLPVIGSDIPVFKEVIGDKYTSFNPYDVSDMAYKITTFIGTKKHIAPELSPKFSFKTMSEEIIKLYRRV